MIHHTRSDLPFHFALADSPIAMVWSRTVLFINYDEDGGFFD